MHKRVNKIIFTKYDMEKIYQISERVMLKLLLKRYRNLPIPVLRLKRNLNIHITLFNLRQTKPQKISGKKRLLKKTDIFLRKLIVSLKNSKYLLPKVKVKPEKLDNFNEKLLNEEYDRIQKTLRSIKKEVIREINSQVTDQFMSIHNILLKMKQKKTLSKRAEVETQKNQVLEA
jgi:hypothetical protein